MGRASSVMIAAALIAAIHAAPAAACGSHRGDTFSSLAGARIYSLIKHRGGRNVQITYACTSRHRPVVLADGLHAVANLPFSDFDFPPTPALVVDGQSAYAALQRAGNDGEVVVLADLRHRRVVTSRVYTQAGEATYHASGIIYSPLFLSNDGFLVYGESDITRCTSSATDCPGEVAVLAMNGKRVLDSGPGVDANSVAVSTSGIAWWLHAGAPRMANVRT